jgi:hypothetical protein
MSGDQGHPPTELVVCTGTVAAPLEQHGWLGQHHNLTKTEGTVRPAGMRGC